MLWRSAVSRLASSSLRQTTQRRPALADPPALNDLQIDPPALAEVDRSSAVRTNSSTDRAKAIKISENVALHDR
jgi:hypothetical protein